MTLGLIDILRVAGFDPMIPTKIVRHQDRRYDVEELRRQDWLELYQQYQGRPRFRNSKQIVTFYGLPGNRAGFYGVYGVIKEGRHSPRSKRLLESWPESAMLNRDSRFRYTLVRDKRFDDLRTESLSLGPAAIGYRALVTSAYWKS